MPSVLRPSVFWKEILGCVLIKSLCRMVKVENVEKQGARFPMFSRFSTYLMGVSVPLCTCVPFRVLLVLWVLLTENSAFKLHNMVIFGLAGPSII